MFKNKLSTILLYILMCVLFISCKNELEDKANLMVQSLGGTNVTPPTLEVANVTPPAGEYNQSSLNVELKTTITGASIRYTLDGITIPSSTEGILYTTPIVLTQSTTINNIVFTKSNYSKVVSSKFILNSASLSDMPYLSLISDSNWVTSAAVTIYRKIQSNITWTASSNNTAMCTLPVTSGLNSTDLSINVSANTTQANRTCTITIQGAGLTANLTLTQNAPPVIITPPPPAVFTITSSDFNNNAILAEEFTCYGNNNFPALSWNSGIPSGTQSFVIIVDDSDASDWVHLNWYSIPSTTTSVSKLNASGGTCNPGTSRCGSVTFPSGTIGSNSFSTTPPTVPTTGWGGPCPPSGTHNYHFQVFAMSIVNVGTVNNTNRSAFRTAHSTHILGSAEIIGRFSK